MDLSTFIDTLTRKRFFEAASPITIARAPGRLDVMGGIADYSGSLVLQRTIAEATFAAVQRCAEPRVDIVSLSAEAGGENRSYSIDLSAFSAENRLDDYSKARRLFENPADHWAAYAAGVFPVLMRERDVLFDRGARVLIASDVPEGKGVASSAALEVATMQAVASAFSIATSPVELAILCQKVENSIAGAPCGLMDQMTSALGEADSLTALLCQPAKLEPPVRVPKEIAFWGLDSGERHAVAGSDYESVRAGTFMGYRMISGEGEPRRKYLVNIPPSEFEQDFLHLLPEQVRGEEFLKRYSRTIDTVTRVDRARTYPIRGPVAHAVYEHHRVRTFRQLLLGPVSEEQWTALGELMYQSHASYSACGLGSKGTSLIVDLVRSMGPAAGLYGARITGGGSGGTVAILGRARSREAVDRVAEMYRTETGYRPYVFSGTSEGAAAYGTKTMYLNP